MGTVDDYARLRAEKALDGVSFGWTDVVLYPVEELEEGRVGYATGADGEDFTGETDGDWRASWLVIGHDGLVGDPIFVDIAEDGFPVCTAAHGQGRWDPQRVADSFQRFGRALEIVEAESGESGSPAELEARPLPAAKRQAILEQIAAENPGAELTFWEALLTS